MADIHTPPLTQPQRRKRFILPLSFYTRFVYFSKHSLWIVAAIVIGIVVWIASDTNVGGARIVMSNVPSAPVEMAQDQDVMQKPHYQGVDLHNQPYTVIADTAVQKDKDTIEMHNVRADMLRAKGSWLALNSLTGLLNTETKQMYLSGGVNLFLDNGNEFRSDHAHVDIQKGNAWGDSHVEGQGPKGTIDADSFTTNGHANTIRFIGSVKVLLY